MLPNFKSLCKILCEWMYLVPAAIWRKEYSTSGSVKFPRFFDTLSRDPWGASSKFQHHVDKVGIFKEFEKLDNVDMIHFPMEVDFSFNFVPGVGSSGKDFLVDDFVRELVPGGSVRDFVNFGKASGAQQFSSVQDSWRTM